VRGQEQRDLLLTLYSGLLLPPAGQDSDEGDSRGDLVWFPIHDELVLHVPDGLVGRVMAEVEQCMRFDFMGVPSSATAVPLLEPDGTSRWMTSRLAETYAVQSRASGSD
jgi:hypothetical protein